MTYARTLVALNWLNLYFDMYKDWMGLAGKSRIKNHKHLFLRVALKRKCEGIIMHDRILINGKCGR